MDIEWVEQVPFWSAVAPRHDWLALLEPVMTRPRHWARVAVLENWLAAYDVAYALRSGRLRRPGGRWEFRGHRCPDQRTSEVYARYLGPD